MKEPSINSLSKSIAYMKKKTIDLLEEQGRFYFRCPECDSSLPQSELLRHKDLKFKKCLIGEQFKFICPACGYSVTSRQFVSEYIPKKEVWEFKKVEGTTGTTH